MTFQGLFYFSEINYFRSFPSPSELYKQQGRKGGRPKALTDDKAETIRALRQAGKMSVKKICETMKISRSVFYRCINQNDSSLN